MKNEPKFSVALNVPEAIAKEFFAKIDLKKCEAQAPKDKPAQTYLGFYDTPTISVTEATPPPSLVSSIQNAIFGLAKPKPKPAISGSIKILKGVLDYCIASITDLQKHYKWCDINKELHSSRSHRHSQISDLGKDIGGLISEFDGLRNVVTKKLEQQVPVSDSFANDMMQCFRHLDENFLIVDSQVQELQGEDW